jgi:hypothetical protein
MKKYTYIYTLVLYICCPLVYAHGDHDHDNAPMPIHKKSVVQTQAVLPLLSSEDMNSQLQSKSQSQNNNFNQISIVLNAKTVTNAEYIRYVFSQFDGLLNIKQPIILGQMVKKGQVLGSITTILNPLENAKAS